MTRRHLLFFLFAALLFALGSLPVLSQSATATLSGTVEDEQGAVIPGAAITILNPSTALQRQTTTNDQGSFTVTLLQPGSYTVTVRRNGFAPIEVKRIVLNVGDNKALTIQLKTGNISEMVQINADAPLLNESPAVGTTVDRQFVANIPLNGRSFQSLLTLTPGVVAVPVLAFGQAGEFSINGQRTESNYYMVDGVAANTGAPPVSPGTVGTSGSLPAESALGTTQSLVSLDALQEFRVQSSTYAAEYGRTPGGQISFVTRSGTNDWHGSVFDYLRNGALDANNWFNNATRLAKTSERQNDFGGTSSGPVILPRFGEGGRRWYNGRNRSFFFFSYEGLRVITPQPAVTTFVPELCLRGVAAQCTGANKPAPAALQPLLNAYPLPNGPANGTTRAAQFVTAFSTPGTLDATSMRIDHNFNANFTVFGRYSESPSEAQTRSISFALSNPVNSSNRVRTLTMAATALPSSRLTNEFRFNYTQNNSSSQRVADTLGGAVPYDLPSITDASGNSTPGLDQMFFVLNFGGIGAFILNDQTSKQRQLNFIDTLSYTVRNHSLKFGADYRRIVTDFPQFKSAETGVFSSATQVQQSLASSAIATAAAVPTLGPLYKNLSLFGQDEWKVSQRLSLLFGLRWELNPPPTDAYGNPPFTVNQISNLATIAVAPRGTPLWQTTYDNFAPRLGIVYQLRRSSGRETVIRGGFGVFYDVGNTLASRGYGLGINTQVTFANVAFPLSATQLTLPEPSVAPPYSTSVAAFDPQLKLPYTLQWNFGVERGLGKNQAITLSYVGAAGRRLLLSTQHTPASSGNPNFLSNGVLSITRNQVTSDYDAFQAQFQRRLSRGLQILASYTWSHSIDESSINTTSTQLQRASSNFDIRHNVQAAVTYDLPSHYSNPVVQAIAGKWALDARFSARSGLPFDLTAGTFIDSTGMTQILRGNLVPGQPIWISDLAAPGGRRVNFNAFTIPTTAQRAAGQFGDSPRNFLQAFPGWQLDFSARREIPVHERLKLQVRGEAFNIFNHPVFGAIRNNLTTGALAFGRATGTLNNQLGALNALYQVGGPRSIQLSLKLVF